MRRSAVFPLLIIKKYSLLIALFSIMLVFGCDESDDVNPITVNEPTDVLLKEYSIPNFWVLGSNIFRELKVELDLTQDVQDAIQDGVMDQPVVYVGFLLESDPENAVYIQLFDDGGSENPNLPEYQNSRSGDTASRDFKYQTLINAHFADDESNYDVKFYAGWFENPADVDPLTNETVPAAYSLDVEINSPPVITITSFPDTLHSGFQPEVWTLDIVDADIVGGDKVVDVTMTIFSDSLESPRVKVFTKDSGNTWKYSADSTFSWGLATGDYRFQFDAMDLFDQKADSVDHEIYLINTTPLLIDPEFPDTVYKPQNAGEDNFYYFRVTALDQQGLGDIDSVYYNFNYPNGDPGLLNLEFFDLGLNGDETAYDGRFVYELKFTSTGTSVLGTYTFSFFARDKAGNLSEPIQGQFVKLEEPGE